MQSLPRHIDPSGLLDDYSSVTDCKPEKHYLSADLQSTSDTAEIAFLLNSSSILPYKTGRKTITSNSKKYKEVNIENYSDDHYRKSTG